MVYKFFIFMKIMRLFFRINDVYYIKYIYKDLNFLVFRKNLVLISDERNDIFKYV